MIRRLMSACAALAVLTPAAMAAGETPRVYPFPSAENYCPAGLQPVTVDGAISCGRPDQAVTYLSVKRHPVQHRAAPRARADDVPPYKGLRE